MSLLGIHLGHDTTFAFSPYPGEYRMYELERLTKVRYDAIDFPSFAIPGRQYDKKHTEWVVQTLYNEILREYGEGNPSIDYDITIDQYITEVNDAFGKDSPYLHIEEVFRKVFKLKDHIKFSRKDHHEMHAWSAFYQSPFDDALVLSLDGGGVRLDDSTDLFKGYVMSREGDCLEVFNYYVPMCPMYDCIPYFSKDIKGRFTAPGKAMGMAGYSGPHLWLYDKLLPFFKREVPNLEKIDHEDGTASLGEHSIYNKILSILPHALPGEKLDFGQSAMVMSTMQKCFEDSFFELTDSIIKKYNLPLVITGGGALNVLNNTRIKNTYNLPVFIPCNPNDTGTAIGGIFQYDTPPEPIDLRFCNWDLFDRNKLEEYVKERNAKTVDKVEISKLLRSGKILGIVKGRSECGPRALGNRSIICDPSFPDMKDTLNAKVKFRQWFRPFAPMVIQEDSEEYFNWDNYEAPNMSFSAIVRGKYRKQLSSITHADYTARIQTVSREDNIWYWELLKELELTGLPLILNTSFNIKGKPILNSIEDALEVLDTTELDGVIVENFLFEKSVDKN